MKALIVKVTALGRKARTVATSIVAAAGVVAAAAPLVGVYLSQFLVEISEGTALELGNVAEDIAQYGTTAGLVAIAVGNVVARVSRVPDELKGLDPIDVVVRPAGDA